MKTFFISDTHFCHNNILVFEPFYRPFPTIKDHDEELIERWNNVVNNKDIVYHLGDVIFSKDKMDLLSRLKGSKRLIMGNHDNFQSASYLKYFDKLHGCLSYDQFILSHVPVNPSNFTRFKGNIHGHLHSKTLDDPRYINVSVEQLPNLAPIEFKTLKENFNTQFATKEALNLGLKP